MKKLLTIVLIIIMVASLPMTVFAANGPMGGIKIGEDEKPIYLAFINLTEPNDKGEYYDESGDLVGRSVCIFDGEKSYDNAAGAKYDITTNTLTLDNLKTVPLIVTNVMGDDFKINVVGDCSVGQIVVWGDHYGGSLNIEGNGTLAVNENKTFDNAIVLQAENTNSALNFGANVKVNLYAKRDVVLITGTPNDSPSKAFTFGNGQTANIYKEPYVSTSYERINGLKLNNAEHEYYGGQKAVCSSDPDGIYTVTTGYKGDNFDKTVYWINRYHYVAPFDAYINDYGFGDFGSIEMTEEEFNNQTEYSILFSQTDEPDQVNYYENPETDDWYYSVNKLSKASDPDGVYGYSTYTTEDSDGNILEEGVYINRFVLAEGTDKYIIDESFEKVKITNEEFEKSDYSIVYAKRAEELKWYGDLLRNTYFIYKDSNSNKYAVDYDNTVYDYVGKDVVNVGGEDFYCVEENSTVSIGSLERSTLSETVEGLYNYKIQDSEFFYKGNEGPSDILVTPIDKAVISGIVKKTYTGKPITQNVSVKLIYKTLKKGTDYTVSYKNNINAGTATITVTGIGNYSGTVSKTFRIDAKKITPKVALSKTSFNYNAKVQKPTVTVKYGTKKLSSSAYSVKFTTGCKNVGAYTVKVTLKGNYSGSKSVSYTINPKNTTLSKVTGGKKQFKASWKKYTTQTTGYQIQYSTDKSFKKSTKTATVKKNNTTSSTVKNLSANKKYYVRIRTYKTVSGKNYYSSWSGSKTVITKK